MPEWSGKETEEGMDKSSVKTISSYITKNHKNNNIKKCDNIICKNIMKTITNHYLSGCICLGLIKNRTHRRTRVIVVVP